MKKKTFAKLSRTVLLVLVAATMLFGVVALPHAQASTYAASAITKLLTVTKIDILAKLKLFCHRGKCFFIK